jgi:hypothetical protein
VLSPITGTVESVSNVTGQVLLREPPERLEIDAYVDGTVVEVMPRQGLVIEMTGAMVQGIFGVGGETRGELRLAVKDPEEPLVADRFRADDKGRVVVGGAIVERSGLERARQVGAAAVVVGGIHDADLRWLLGYDIGVAITGTEAVGFTLIATEGFGRIAMARKTFDLLAELQGRRASLSGATQIRAGVIRPEILVPEGPGSAGPASKAVSEGIGEGTMVRLIREPHFGKIGTIVESPVELQGIGTESRARVFVVRIGVERVVVPRTNVEMIEG